MKRRRMCELCGVRVASATRYVCGRCKGDAIPYTPIETILEMPTVRVLRAMRHHGWICGVDLLDSLHIPGETLERFNYHTIMYRLRRDGLIERRRLVGSTEYRITDAGRRDLARRLTVDMEVDPNVSRADLPRELRSA